MAFFHIRRTKTMDIYIYSDESGVFDYLHNDYFVFAGGCKKQFLITKKIFFPLQFYKIALTSFKSNIGQYMSS